MMKPTNCLLILTAGLIVLYLTPARAGLLPYGAYPGPGDLEFEGISDDSHETVDLTGAFKFHGTWYSNLTVSFTYSPFLHFIDWFPALEKSILEIQVAKTTPTSRSEWFWLPAFPILIFF